MTETKKRSPIGVVFIALAIFVVSLGLLRPGKRINPNMDFRPKIGAQLPLETPLTDELGVSVKLGDYFAKGKPVVILPIFYKCGAVCRAELDSLTKVIAVEVGVSTRKQIDSVYPGRDYELVVVSLHPNEVVADAAAKKSKFFEDIAKPMESISADVRPRIQQTMGDGMHFTVGKPEDIKLLVNTLGVEYTYDAKKNWVNHPGVAAYVSKVGTVIGYNTGDTFNTKLFRAGILDATAGRPEPIGDVKLLGCIQIGSTSPIAQSLTKIVNVLAVVFMLGMGTMIFKLLRNDSNRNFLSGGDDAPQS